MKRKIRVAVIFGGRSAEHEVSLQSARNVIEAIDKTKFEPILVGIDKDGRWLLNQQGRYLLHADDPKKIQLCPSETQLALAPGPKSHEMVPISGSSQAVPAVDVAFPVLHGTYGEDGTMQGLLKMADIPFVGPGVLASSVGMDKEVAKRLMRDAGLPVGKFLSFTKAQKGEIRYSQVVEALGSPVFIKPSNQGSSVGISRASNDAEFTRAIQEAFSFDRKILIEEALPGREIEVAVLGNDDPKASLPGEIVVHGHDFYSYEAKYLDASGSTAHIPAKLTQDQIAEAQALAVKTFQVLCCEGMARVDFFLTKAGKFYVNEINTIPGFTNISMYPKMWEASGLSYSDLITRLIELALERHEKESQIKTTFF